MWQLYLRVAVVAAQRSVRSWLAALSIPIYGVIVVGAAVVLAPLGLLGGLLLSLLALACCAGYLAMLADAVGGSRIVWSDLRKGMRNFWDVCSVGFALMIIGFVVSFIARAAGPNGEAVMAVAGLASAFFFNVVPELLYHSRSRSFALLRESVQFV